jgi:zinc resistance-associated protein
VGCDIYMLAINHSIGGRPMWKAIFAGTTALTIAGATLGMAQQTPDRDSLQRSRPSTEGRSAFIDAQLAELKAGLRLTPSQEKYWPDFEAVLRERAKQRAAEQRRLADVLNPLYNSLDASQQQRFAMLFRTEGERRSTFSYNRDQMESDRQMDRGPRGAPREGPVRGQLQKEDEDQIGSDRQMDRGPRGAFRYGPVRGQLQKEDEDQIGSDRQMNREPQGPYRERSSRSQRRMDDQMGSDRQMDRGPRGAFRDGAVRGQRQKEDDL